MLAFTIPDTKSFMNLLLKQDTFENINQAVKMLGASGVRTDEKSGEEAQ